MKNRSDRPRSSQGPLTKEEFLTLLEQSYSDSSRRFFARHWSTGEEPQDVADAADNPFELDLDDLHPRARAIFGQIVQRHGRARGENVRRSLLLSGFGESRDALRELIAQGKLIVLPTPGEHDCAVEHLLETDAFLQRELAVFKPAYDALSTLDTTSSLDGAAWAKATPDPGAATVDDLELNLLHIASLVRQIPLRLNKDGTPNRRSLGRIARGITMPDGPGEVAADLDLHDVAQFDFLTFIVSLARELHLLIEADNTCRTDDDALARFFHSDGAERDRRILDALQRLRFWNEIDSLRLAGSSARTVDDDHFSQRESTGQPLIGARGFVFSVLRRAQFSGWIAMDALIELCTQLDRQYLDRTLSQLPHQPEPEEFIRAVLKRTLVWSGMLELGRSEHGQRLARLAPRGARALGFTHELPAPRPGGCLIVQPNFEVMVFLDNAPVTILQQLYRVGERRKLSDRVATFQLTAESVQRGYGLGADAESLLKLLNQSGHTPVPDTVAFQLRDWERVHRRLIVHLGGASLRHPDPERFDLICGQLEHDLRDSSAQLIRLGARDAFVTDGTHPALQRAIDAHPSLVLDALGPPPRCFYFVDPLVLMIDPYECDIITRVELDHIATPLPEESSPRSQFFELSIDKIKARFPEDPLKGITAFLDPRCDGGLPATQSLRLQAELSNPARIHLQAGITVLTFEDVDAAQRFCQLSEAPDLLTRQLGPKTFAVATAQIPLLHELIDELRLDASFDPFRSK